MNATASRGERPCAAERFHVGFVLHSLAGGGAERVAICLAKWLIDRGHRVDVVLGKSVVQYTNSLPKGMRLFHPAILGMGRRTERLCAAHDVEVRRVHANARHAPRDFARLRSRANGVRVQQRHVYFAHLVAQYLRRERPSLLLSSLAPANFAAVNAARLVPDAPPVVISVHNNLRLDYSAYEQRVAATLYPRANAVVGVSQGVCTGLHEALGLATDRTHAIYNPLPISHIQHLTEADVYHPWFQPGEPQVILSVGREAPAKDYPALVEAFGRVRHAVTARLVIMGGHSRRYRARLHAQARRLGVERDLGFIDFDENPYRYMARAAVVALSSFWEGLPTVLLEALACGTPVVSTDTPYGPREILGDGQWGRLAPVGDAAALGQALLETLRGGGTPADALRLRAAHFSEERAASAYLRLFEQVAAAHPSGALEFAAQTLARGTD